MVGNGDNIGCAGICPELSVELDHTIFTIPFFVLLVEGPDLILGVAWLRTLGPILADFVVPQIAFHVGPKKITLRGESLSSSLSPPQLKTLLHNTSISSLHTLYFHFEPNPSPTSPKTPHPYPNIEKLIQTYSSIFDKPKHLPPSRSQNHHIPTILNTAPVNVKP